MSQAPRGLHGILVHDLGRKIADGTHPPGTTLALDALCAEYDASRPTVREALRVLESKGMLRIRQSLGTRVQPTADWNLLDAEVVSWRLEGPDRSQQVRELLQMRLAIEPVAAGLTAQVAAPDVLENLESALDDMRVAAAADDVRAFTEADVSFHAALLAQCGNQMFPLLTALVATALEERAEVLTRHHADLSGLALKQHGDVLAAIRAHDSGAAERRMRTMLGALLAEPAGAADASA